MKLKYFTLLCTVALLFISSCDTPVQEPKKSDAKDITAFSIVDPPAKGTISGTDISVMLPYGVAKTNLVAQFTATGKSVTVGGAAQVSGTSTNNYTNPVSYVVSAEDDSTKTYTVTVANQPISAKALTAFSFKNVSGTGVISGNAVAITVPFGTNVTNLVANFETTGVSVDINDTIQVSGTTMNDFSSPVEYTVTAGDNSTAIYTVTVTVAPNTAKDITAFSIVTPAAAGVINGTDITVTVPFETDVTELVATFTTSGESVEVNGVDQVSGTTVNDFSNPVEYVVTAADSSTKTYTVTVAFLAGESFDASKVSIFGTIEPMRTTLGISEQYYANFYVQYDLGEPPTFKFFVNNINVPVYAEYTSSTNYRLTDIGVYTVGDSIDVIMIDQNLKQTNLTLTIPPPATSFTVTPDLPAKGTANTQTSYTASWPAVAGANAYVLSFHTINENPNFGFSLYTTSLTATLREEYITNDGVPIPFFELSFATVNRKTTTGYKSASIEFVNPTLITKTNYQP